MVESSIGSVAD